MTTPCTNSMMTILQFLPLVASAHRTQICSGSLIDEMSPSDFSYDYDEMLLSAMPAKSVVSFADLISARIRIVDIVKPNSDGKDRRKQTCLEASLNGTTIVGIWKGVLSARGKWILLRHACKVLGFDQPENNPFVSNAPIYQPIYVRRAA